LLLNLQEKRNAEAGKHLINEDHRPNGRRQSVKGIDYLTMYVIIYTSFLSKHFWPCTLLWYTKWNNSEDAIAMKVAGELKLKKKKKE